MRRLAVGFVLLIAGLSGCGEPCNASSQCALSTDHTLCDGEAWLACDPSAVGKEVVCAASHKTAVCTPDGWTFQNSGQ